MRFFTWNTQGDFQKRDKFKRIEDLFNVSGCQIGFIQEGGTDHGNGQIGDYSIFAGPQVGAKNERCTNYVLVKRSAFPGQVPQSVLLQAVGGGVAGRSAACAKVGNYIFVSWHSTASPASEDTAQLLTEVVQKWKGSVTVVGGDFNATPTALEAMVARKAGTRSHAGTAIDAKGALQSTHSSGKALDHFVVVGQGASGRANVRVISAPGTSDHDPVVMEMQL